MSRPPIEFKGKKVTTSYLTIRNKYTSDPAHAERQVFGIRIVYSLAVVEVCEGSGLDRSGGRISYAA